MNNCILGSSPLPLSRMLTLQSSLPAFRFAARQQSFQSFQVRCVSPNHLIEPPVEDPLTRLVERPTNLETCMVGVENQLIHDKGNYINWADSERGNESWATYNPLASHFIVAHVLQNVLEHAVGKIQNSHGAGALHFSGCWHSLSNGKHETLVDQSPRFHTTDVRVKKIRKFYL